MRSFTYLFQINGKPMLTPDSVTDTYTDLDGQDSGRDESGYMHRIVLRSKVLAQAFTYTNLTEEEKQYMERLFPDSATFQYTHPDRVQKDKEVITQAYRSNYGIVWKNARTGLWKNYKFNIIEC